MAPMADLTLIGSNLMPMNEDDLNDEALRLALMDYADTVTGLIDTHIWPPYLQLVEDEDDGTTYLWWLAYSFEADQPDARVLKRAVLRDYITTVEMEKMGMEDDHFDVFDDDDIDLVELMDEVARLMDEDESLAEI